MTRKLVALTVVVLLPAGLMIWHRAHQSSGFAPVELIVYPLLFGSLGIAAVLSLKRWYLKRPLSDFNASPGTVPSDLLQGLALTAIYFALFFLFRATLSDLLGSTPNLELLGLMLEMRESPLLLVLFFGPVLWVGVALFEELIRVFTLGELWSFSDAPFWTVTVIALAAVLFGLVHWSQGPYGVVTIAIQSVVAGAYYHRRRRLLPLVVAHALYDGVQVAALLLTYPS